MNEDSGVRDPGSGRHPGRHPALRDHLAVHGLLGYDQAEGA